MAVIGVVTAIISAYAGYRAIPDQVTMADWTRRTNALCEREAAALRDPVEEVSDVVQDVTVLIGQGNLSAVASDLDTTARSLQASADAYRSFVGTVRELDPPEDEDEVVAFLDAGTAVYRGMDTVVLDLKRAAAQLEAMPAPGAADPDWLEGMTVTLARALGDMSTLQRLTWPTYEQAVLDRDLTQCEGWNPTGKPRPVPPVQTAVPSPRQPGVLNADEKALVRRLGLPVGACRVADTPSRARGALAELNCRGTGLNSDPAFLRFDNLEDLRAWFGVKGDQVGDCGEGDNVELDLPQSSPHPGRMRCFPMSAGGFRAELMLTDSLIGIAAQDAGPSALQRWVDEFLATPSL